MISKKQFHTIDEVQKLQYLATQCEADVSLQSLDSSKIIDAKSYIGFYALDFRQPILVVCDDADFHKAIREIGETVE